MVSGHCCLGMYVLRWLAKPRTHSCHAKKEDDVNYEPLRINASRSSAGSIFGPYCALLRRAILHM